MCQDAWNEMPCMVFIQLNSTLHIMKWYKLFQGIIITQWEA